MATQSPLLLLQNIADGLLANFKAPDWAIEEVQRRIVLLLNHVLMQEQAATGRLERQAGRVVLVQWNAFSMRLMVTPAGLLDLALAQATPDLSLLVTEPSPVAIAQAMLRSGKPAVRIEGDVQLAADVNWLVDNLRWDVEDDLARLIGDAPANAMGQAARSVAQAVRGFLGTGATPPGAGGAAP